MAVELFLLQRLVAPRLERPETLFDPPGPAAVEPDGGAREVGEKAPVVADQDQGRAQALELVFQPFDGGQVEVVGGFVEQQDVGLGRQHAGQGGTTKFASRKMRRLLLSGQAEIVEQAARTVGIIEGSQACLDIGQHIGVAREIRLLGENPQRRVGLQEPLSSVGFDQAFGDPHQGGFAGTVAADEADAVSSADLEVDPFEQRFAAEGEANIGQLQKRRRHEDPGGMMRKIRQSRGKASRTSRSASARCRTTRPSAQKVSASTRSGPAPNATFSAWLSYGVT